MAMLMILFMINEPPFTFLFNKSLSPFARQCKS